jgi:hypothetical protein
VLLFVCFTGCCLLAFEITRDRGFFSGLIVEMGGLGLEIFLGKETASDLTIL